MAYTPIPLILDRMLSAGVKYERELGIAASANATAEHPASQERVKRASLLVIAQQRIRKQYKMIG